MNDVVILGIVCLGLAGWVIYLRNRLRIVEMLLMAAMDMTKGIADGTVVVDKTSDGVLRIRTKKEVVFDEEKGNE